MSGGFHERTAPRTGRRFCSSVARSLPEAQSLQTCESGTGPSPGILADVTRFKVFRAVLEWKYQHYSCTDKRLLCFDFGFPHAVSPEQVIERISTNLNTPSLDAVRGLGRYMGISPENVFSIFPVSERRQMICNSEPQECIPHALNLADGCYQLSHVERQYDFAGYVEQAICVYNNKMETVLRSWRRGKCSKITTARKYRI